jgi:hypothetical protein
LGTSVITETSVGELFTTVTVFRRVLNFLIFMVNLIIILVLKGAKYVATGSHGVLHGYLNTSLSLECSKLPLVFVTIVHRLLLLLLLVLHVLVVWHVGPHSLVGVHFMLLRTILMVILHLFLIDLFHVVLLNVVVYISSLTVLQIVIDIIVYLILDITVFLRINVDVGMVILRSLILMGHVVLIVVAVVD